MIRSFTYAFAAAATTRLRVGVGVCLVPARDPIVLAKQVASLDVLSNGRMVLGVGAGWNREEVEDHGVAGPQRWAVIRERVLAIREIWTTDTPSFSGEHVRFEPMWSWPKPRQRPYPPILVGGHGEKVLRPRRRLRGRVARHGRARRTTAAGADGGAGGACRQHGADPADGLRAALRHAAGWHVIEKYVEAGVDRIDFSVPHEGPDDRRATIEVLATVVDRWTV